MANKDFSLAQYMGENNTPNRLYFAQTENDKPTSSEVTLSVGDMCWVIATGKGYIYDFNGSWSPIKPE